MNEKDILCLKNYIKQDTQSANILRYVLLILYEQNAINEIETYKEELKRKGRTINSKYG